MEKKQKFVKLTVDATYDKTRRAWNVNGDLEGYAPKTELAEVIADSIKFADKGIAAMIALTILTGSPIPWTAPSETTVIDLGAIEKAMG